MTYNVFSGTLNPTHFTSLQKFSSGTGSPGWSWIKHRKTVVACGVWLRTTFTKRLPVSPRSCRCCRGRRQRERTPQASSLADPSRESTAASEEVRQTVPMGLTRRQCLQWTPAPAPAQTGNSCTHRVSWSLTSLLITNTAISETK